ncbi:MAG: 1,4-alpha-glucan branching protein GlgB [Candidatus Omnitrophica bacterium]|nr:1,4-alpha-glucan branching protein GlgB [Candidatus Omnitrophota bacterium]
MNCGTKRQRARNGRQGTTAKSSQNNISAVRHDVSLFSELDIYLFREGTHFRIYEKLGNHLIAVEGVSGVYFAVWAPNARAVSVIGDFNQWNAHTHPLAPRADSSGIWEGFIPGLQRGDLYKYAMVSPHRYVLEKADPYAYRHEQPPRTASCIWDLEYEWSDRSWMSKREYFNRLQGPWSVYEVHLGSWRRVPEDGDRWLNYRELAPLLADYVSRMGFTHVEFMPVLEHPFYPSWGYQGTGFFAPTSRYGTPQDFMFLVDYLHQCGIGVILDWVPSHFPGDGHGLAGFDGTHLYEHADPRKGFHPDWKSYIFNYGRNEVKIFLISNALFWLERYHIDALRIDAVASMLYLDYSRQEGQWVPNEQGGRDNRDAIAFLKRLNEEIYKEFPGTQTIAEESTDWPRVSRPTYADGVGFGMKWNMGWMHDTLEYIKKDPVYRKHHHNQLTFSIWYAFCENFLLSLSHDEVVHGKGSLLGKMPGGYSEQFANLRLLYGYLYAHPGKKLLFMGGEFGQWNEWSHDGSLDWHLLEYPAHRGLQHWVRDLNFFYRGEPSLYERDFSSEGFYWINLDDWQHSVIVFARRGDGQPPAVVVAANFTPVARFSYRIGVPYGGYWKEMLNSDAVCYGGGGVGNGGGAWAEPVAWQGQPYSLSLAVPPLGILFLKGPF